MQYADAIKSALLAKTSFTIDASYLAIVLSNKEPKHFDLLSEAISNSPNLTELCLNAYYQQNTSMIGFAEKISQNLCSLTRLTIELNPSHVEILFRGLSTNTTITNLKLVTSSTGGVEDDGLGIFLQKNSTVKELEIQNLKFVNNSIENLGKNKGITKLRIVGTSTVNLGKILAENNSLKELSGCFPGYFGFSDTGLAKNSCLQKLHLGKCKIFDFHTFCNIVDQLQNNSTLQELNFFQTQLCRKHVFRRSQFNYMLAMNTSLRKIVFPFYAPFCKAQLAKNDGKKKNLRKTGLKFNHRTKCCSLILFSLTFFFSFSQSNVTTRFFTFIMLL